MIWETQILESLISCLLMRALGFERLIAWRFPYENHCLLYNSYSFISLIGKHLFGFPLVLHGKLITLG